MAWRHIAAILASCAIKPEATELVVKALVALVKTQPPQLNLAGFEAVMSLVVRLFEANESPHLAVDPMLPGRIVATLEETGAWLTSSGYSQAQSGDGCPRGMTAEQRVDLLR